MAAQPAPAAPTEAEEAGETLCAPLVGVAYLAAKPGAATKNSAKPANGKPAAPGAKPAKKEKQK